MRLSLRLLPAFLALSLSAHADVVQNFNVSGAFTDISTLSGTIGVDTTSGVLQTANVVYMGGTYTAITYQGANSTQDAYLFFLSQPGSTYPELLLGVAGLQTLTGFSGGTLCSEANLCNGALSSFDPAPNVVSALLETGSVTPLATAVSPEPSSFVLLSTGMLVIAGMARRRLYSA